MANPRASVGFGVGERVDLREARAIKSAHVIRRRIPLKAIFHKRAESRRNDPGLL